MRRIAGFVLTALVPVAILSDLLLACICGPSLFLEDSDRAPLIFVGTVLERRDKPCDADGTMSSGDPAECLFDVGELLKGEPLDTVTVCTARMGASCGHPFQEGSEYLVYASARREGSWPCPFSVSLCSRTRPAPAARGEIALLRAALAFPPEVKERERRLVKTAQGWLAQNDLPKSEVVDALAVLAPASRSAAGRVAALWRDGDVETKWAVLEALSKFGNHSGDVLRVCVDACRHEDARFRRRGLMTLVAVAPRSDRAAEEVYTALADENEEVRDCAVHLLAGWGSIEKSKGAAVIRRALGRGLLARRIAAVDAIEQGEWEAWLSWRDLEPMLDSDSLLWRAGAVAALRGVEVDSADADRLLRRGLRDPEHSVRCIAANTAGELADRGVPTGRIMETALADSSESVARIAASRIRMLGRNTEESCRLAAIACRDPRPAVRYQALKAAIGSERCEASILRVLMNDRAPRVRSLVLELLLCRPEFTDSARAVALRGLEDPDPEVVCATLSALALPPQRVQFALEPVMRLASHPDSSVRAAAVRTHKAFVRSDARQR